MWSVLLKLSLLKRLLVLGAAGAGHVSPATIAVTSAVGLGALVGIGAVLVRRGPALSEARAPNSSTGSPFLVAFVGLVLGSLAMAAYLAYTGQWYDAASLP
jgi:hypothetical protein